MQTLKETKEALTFQPIWTALFHAACKWPLATDLELIFKESLSKCYNIFIYLGKILILMTLWQEQENSSHDHPLVSRMLSAEFILSKNTVVKIVNTNIKNSIVP